MGDDRPMDDLSVQVTGRLLALEILVFGLLSQKSGSARLLAQAGATVSHIEAESIKGANEDQAHRILNVCAAARLSIDKLAADLRAASRGK